jgi:hypothetical protein
VQLLAKFNIAETLISSWIMHQSSSVMQQNHFLETFSDNEWNILMQAPMQAVVAVVLVDKLDPAALLKISQATMRTLANEQRQQNISNELTKALIRSINQADDRLSVQGEELLLRKEFMMLGQLHHLNRTAEGRQIAIEHCKQVSYTVSCRTTAIQAQGFKVWLLSFVYKVIKGAKQGSLLGVADESITQRERWALAELRDILEVNVLI